MFKSVELFPQLIVFFAWYKFPTIIMQQHVQTLFKSYQNDFFIHRKKNKFIINDEFI